MFDDTWEGKGNEWLPYVKNNVLSTAFCYARYLMGMEEITFLVWKLVNITLFSQ